MPRQETDYNALTNRCSHCGHRVLMHDENGCLIVTRDPEKPTESVSCPCKGKRRVK